MTYQYANVMVVSALICFSLSIIAWSRRSSPGAKSLAVIMLALGIWSASYAARWLTDQTSSIYFWLNIMYTGVVLAPPAMLLFSFQFTRNGQYFTHRRIALFAIEPILTLILIWTDPLHGLFFGGMRSTESILNGGIWFWFNTFYSFILMLISVRVLYRYMQHASKHIKRQTQIMLLGFLIPIIGCAIGILGFRPFSDLDLTPFYFIISSCLVIYGFFYYRLLDISPIAYSKLVQTSQDGLIVLDKQQRIVDMNPAGVQILKPYSGSIGEEASIVFSAWPDIMAILEKGTSATIFIQTKSDPKIDYEVTISLLHDSYERSEGWFLNFHDISRYKQTEEALLFSENKIRSLFYSISDNVLILDKNGRYLEIAPTNPPNNSKDPLQVVGRTVFEIFPENESAVIMNAIHQVLKSKKMVQLDYSMMINNQMFWFSGNVSPLTEDSVIWIARDITERKQMEHTLRESESRLEMAQNSAHIGNWEIDLVTEEFFASAEYYRILGMNPVTKKIPMSELEKQFSFANMSRWAEMTTSWMVNLTPFERDIEIIREGEFEPRILHIISAIDLDSEGKPHKASGVVQDITTQKQVEKALAKRMLALTRPLDKTGIIDIEDLFNLEDLQRIQDDFAFATGVASLIIREDGSPITKQSNFCRICGEIIRKNEIGLQNCYENDADLGRVVSHQPFIMPCKSIGLMHAGAPINVGGQHIASWLIGQVRGLEFSEEKMLDYIRKIGIDENTALTAFKEVPVMSQEQFARVAQSLFTFSTQLSNAAFQNIQQARFISDRRQAEEALQVSENKLRSLFQAMTDVIIIYDSEGRYREIAPTSSQRYYLPPSEMIERSISEIFPSETAALFLNTIRQTLESKEMSRLDYCLQIGGHEYWFSANVSPLTEDTVIWVAHDITDRKKVEDSLQYQSMHDILTGLYNRQYYETEIDRLQRSRLFPISIMVMDVDGLKWVNDHRGHTAGDELLQRVAGILKSAFRPEDMVARMGGDEFVVVLPETGELAASQTVQRMNNILDKHNQLFPPDLCLGLSVGVATGGQGILLTEVFKQADQAMYLNKSKKKELAQKTGFAR